MTRGALIFAFNNEHIDYLAMAAWSANNIRQHLAIPVAVITDITDSPSLEKFDQVIYHEPAASGGRWFGDFGTHVPWRNADRIWAYHLSPWDQTLLLDSDYVINSDSLSVLFETGSHMLCFRRSILATDPDRSLLPTFGRHQLPMFWATVIYFQRSDHTALTFSAMQMIYRHWNHYRDLYGIAEDAFRNDYALSIALDITNGHTGEIDSISWSMISVLPEQQLTMQRADNHDVWTVGWQDDQSQARRVTLSGMDFHAMGKRSLLEAISG